MIEAQAQTLLTGDDLLDLSTGMGQRYELIEGVLVTMAPTNADHGLVESSVSFLLKAFNRQHKLGRVLTGKPGFYTRGDNRTVRAPDVAFISYERLPRGALPPGFLTVAPDLVVEVVSPGDRAGEIDQKAQEWLDFGAKAVWVIYPESQRVYVHTAKGVHRLSAADTLDGGEALPGFQAMVGEFFEE